MSQSHEELRRLFDLLTAAPAEDRDVILTRECSDADLRQRVLAMVAASEDTRFLAAPTGDGPDATDAPTVAHPGREQAGRQIGHYKLLQVIGEGGFGTVWMAEQRQPVKRRVALKIIKLGMDTEQVIARFEAERQALAMMDHPNIAKVFDAGSTETGRPYFVMEYIRGVPILEYCDTERLPPERRLMLFVQVCHAIQHAHQKGIIHRDIKPNNVLVTLHDGVPVPKVIDFGIAKATSAELPARTLFTEHRQMIGTPEYMSPEQAEMSGLDIDTRSDIYSLGVLLYELLTGTTPFDTVSLRDAGLAEMMRIIREEEPHRPSTRLSELGDTASRTAEQRRVDVRRLATMLRGDLDWIVMKCLEKDRTRRYETATGLAHDIMRHINDEPVLAGPPAAGYRFRKFVRRNRARVIAAGIMMSILILGAVGTSWGMIWAINERQLVASQADTALTALSNAQVILRDTMRDLAATGQDTHVLTDTELDALDGQEVQTLAERARDLAVDLSRSLQDEARSRQTAERIAEFQEARLGAVDVEMMGIQLRRMLLDSVAEDERDALGAALDPINFTTIAQGAMDESIFDVTIAAIDQEFAEDPLLRARLLHATSGALLNLGMHDVAVAPQRTALELRTTQLGGNHELTLGSAQVLAHAHRARANFDEAEMILAPALEHAYQDFGADHVVTTALEAERTSMLVDAGRAREAIEGMATLIETRTRLLGPKHPDTLDSIHNMADALWQIGDYAAALEINETTLATRRELLPETDPDILASLNNLALNYRDLSRWDEAEAIFNELIELEARLYGDNHPKTLRSRSNYAGLKRLRGQFDVAEELLVDGLARMSSVFGRSHPMTAQALGEYANLLIETGRYEEAETHILETLDLARRSFGTHFRTIHRLRLSLASLYMSIGRLSEAETMLRSLITEQERELGNEDPELITSQLRLGQILMSQRRLPEALAVTAKAAEDMEDLLGPLHHLTLGAKSSLATTYLAMMRLNDAKPLLEVVYAAQTQTLGDEHKSTLMTGSTLAMVYAMQGDADRADAMLRQAIEVYIRTLGPEHATTLGTINNHGRILLMQQKPGEALEQYERVLDPLLRVLGPDHQWTRAGIQGLNAAYSTLGRSDELIEVNRRVLQRRLEIASAEDASPQDLHAAASALLTDRFTDLHDPEQARSLASRAVEHASVDDALRWRFLQTLATAQARLGDAAAAVDTQRQAVLAAPEAQRPKAQSLLESYEAALADGI